MGRASETSFFVIEKKKETKRKIKIKINSIAERGKQRVPKAGPARPRLSLMALSLDVRALVRAARSRAKQGNAEGDAEERERERRAAFIIDRASAAADAVATRTAELKNTSLAADVVEGVSYWPDFVSKEEEQSLVAAIDLVSKGRWIGGESDDRFAKAATATTSTSTSSNANKHPLPNRLRRRANFGGSPSSLASSEELPRFLKTLCEALTLAGAFERAQPANHVLINDYGLGAGLPRHSDGPLYAASATITLCGPAALELHRIEKNENEEEEEGGKVKDEKENDNNRNKSNSSSSSSIQLLLRPRAALSLRGESYERWEHGVPAVEVDEIRENCANLAEAGVRVGERVPRAPRRISLVFVNKRKQGAA